MDRSTASNRDRVKRQYTSKRKRDMSRDPKQNLYRCICGEGERTGRGQRHHRTQCAMELWLAGDLDDPTLGMVLHGMAGTCYAGMLWCYTPEQKRLRWVAQ